MVGWELLGEGLKEVPRGFGSVDRAQSSLVSILAGVCTKQEGGVLFRRSRIVKYFYVASDKVVRDVLERIIAQADLHWLIEEQHIHFVVPGVFAEVCGVRIRVDVARSILNEETQHGRAAGTSVHPDGQRCILWVLPGLEEPEESVDGVVLLVTQIIEAAWREMDVARVAADAFRSFTDVVLGLSATCFLAVDEE